MLKPKENLYKKMFTIIIRKKDSSKKQPNKTSHKPQETESKIMFIICNKTIPTPIFHQAYRRPCPATRACRCPRSTSTTSSPCTRASTTTPSASFGPRRCHTSSHSSSSTGNSQLEIVVQLFVC